MASAHRHKRICSRKREPLMRSVEQRKAQPRLQQVHLLDNSRGRDELAVRVMPMRGKDCIFTLSFFANAFVNLTLYANYYVLMIVMDGYCIRIRNGRGNRWIRGRRLYRGALAAHFAIRGCCNEQIGQSMIAFFGNLGIRREWSSRLCALSSRVAEVVESSIFFHRWRLLVDNFGRKNARAYGEGLDKGCRHRGAEGRSGIRLDRSQNLRVASRDAVWVARS